MDPILLILSTIRQIQHCSPPFLIPSGMLVYVAGAVAWSMSLEQDLLDVPKKGAIVLRPL